MKGWQSMKRIITTILATVLLGGVLVALSPAAAAAARAPNDCSFSHQHYPALYNGLAWSSSDMNAWHTPKYRAGACGKAYVEFLGVYNAPACMYAKLVTYNADGSRNYVGPWYNFQGIGRLINVRGSGHLSNNRAYRIYAYGCGRFRHPNFPPGFRIYTHA